eukprot:CFRG3542T1
MSYPPPNFGGNAPPPNYGGQQGGQPSVYDPNQSYGAPGQQQQAGYPSTGNFSAPPAGYPVSNIAPLGEPTVGDEIRYDENGQPMTYDRGLGTWVLVGAGVAAAAGIAYGVHQHNKKKKSKSGKKMKKSGKKGKKSKKSKHKYRGGDWSSSSGSSSDSSSSSSDSD